VEAEVEEKSLMSGRHVVAAGRVLTIAALALTAIPFGAEAEVAGASPTAVAWKPPPGMLEALQRDLGLSRSQAQARLLNEARLIPVEAQLRRRLGARFGGSWLRGTTAQTLVVATTSSADIPQIIAAGVQAEVVSKSLAQLALIKQKLDAALPVQPIVASVRYVDVKTNAVVVLTQDPDRLQNVIESAGVDKTAVVVRPSSEQPRPLTDLVGGNAYYISGTTRCSIGFPVVRGAVKGFVSAGHCGKAGNTTTGFNRVTQGVFQASTFPTSDYSWVAVNSGWTPRPAVDNGEGGTIPVAGARVAVEGASVCRSGSTTDFHCGLIQQRDASVTYPQGKVFGLTRTNVCAEPGDSGGSFISVDQAQGVTSGGFGDCSSGGTTYFQPIVPILTAYGLSLVTTAGNPPPPTTGTCTGYPNTYTGTLTSGNSAYQPRNSYFRSNVGGLHTACLDGPDGVDFDLYLQKWNGTAWVNVAAGTSAGADEKITYTGTAGYYRYRVFASSGSGSYTLGYKAP
jgi:hypothetical protein